jgi:hypothetical protein
MPRKLEEDGDVCQNHNFCGISGVGIGSCYRGITGFLNFSSVRSVILALAVL